MSELAKKLIKCLGLECDVFEAGLEDDTPVMKAYFRELKVSKKHEFFPVILSVSDSLLETFENAKVSKTSPNKLLNAKLPNLNKKFEEFYIELLSDEFPQIQTKFKETFTKLKTNKAFIGEFSSSDEPLNQPLSIWDSATDLTNELLLVKVPVKNPWEVFAYLPFGGWNECPNVLSMIAFAKMWHEKHGVLPCAISSDGLDFYTGENSPKLSKNQVIELACWHYFFCNERLEQCSSNGSIGSLAKELSDSNFWYFWWD